jgi:hypothetical protein
MGRSVLSPDVDRNALEFRALQLASMASSFPLPGCVATGHHPQSATCKITSRNRYGHLCTTLISCRSHCRPRMMQKRHAGLRVFIGQGVWKGDSVHTKMNPHGTERARRPHLIFHLFGATHSGTQVSGYVSLQFRVWKSEENEQQLADLGNGLPVSVEPLKPC